MAKKIGFQVGEAVVVKPGIKEEDTGLDMSGWQGRISEVDEENEIIVVDWDSITLRQMPASYIELCEEEGFGWTQYYLVPGDIQSAAARDTPRDVKQAIEELGEAHAWEWLGEEGKAIQAVLKNVDPDDDFAAMEAWAKHLGKTLKFPFPAEVSEFQEGGPLRSGDKVTVRKINMVDETYGVIVDVQGKRGVLQFPLCDLTAVDENSINAEHVGLYATWFANR